MIHPEGILLSHLISKAQVITNWRFLSLWRWIFFSLTLLLSWYRLHQILKHWHVFKSLNSTSVNERTVWNYKVLKVKLLTHCSARTKTSGQLIVCHLFSSTANIIHSQKEMWPSPVLKWELWSTFIPVSALIMKSKLDQMISFLFSDEFEWLVSHKCLEIMRKFIYSVFESV